MVRPGKQYTVWLQGEKVMTYKSDSAIEEGWHSTAWQSCHGNVDYRKIKLAELP